MTDNQKRQLKSTQRLQKRSDEDLVDLPEQVPEATWKQYLLTPKFILLVIMTVGIIGRNIYLQYNKTPEETAKQNAQKKEIPTEMSEQMFSRFFWYTVLTVILLVVFILLKRSNDAAQEQKIRAEVLKQEEEAEKQRKIQQKANKILTSMDQFGNVIDEEAFKKKDKQPETAEAQQVIQTKKDQ